MNVTIQTPTGAATIDNAQSAKGQKAMLEYIKLATRQRQPFVVLPPNTEAIDLRDVTSVDNFIG